VNKYLHTVASVGFLFTLNYDARNHELKKVVDLLRPNPHWRFTIISSIYGVKLDVGYWIKFRTKLTKVICLYNYYSLFYHLFINRHNDRFLPLLRQLLLVQLELISLWISGRNILPPALISSARIWSIPGNLCLFIFSTTISKALGSGTSDSVVCMRVCLTSLTPCTFNSWEKWLLNLVKIL